ncbi:methyltransferase, FkbM family [Singulisphaera sp. GP187]|uniref:FkbM family methyltransferase n=1 Tax=Singulisphaera sp. GP187 TaxID=1882752 RepID=UPI000926E6B9|nr:FkbM family methyltransferase [Singulisphaera sp. GP187]SIO62230.1 methyltransferase, FkbM family [Singulisphaera sp. GP187]
MDESSKPTDESRSSEASRFRVIDRVGVQPGLTFAAVIDPCASDSISLDLAAGRFPSSTRPAIEYLQASTSRGGRVLDLGTHVGTFTLAAAALGYEVIGVEASPRNVALLRASLQQNGFDRVHLVNAAVSDRSGTVEFSQAGPYGHVGAPEAGQTSVSVPAVKIDDLLAEWGWDRVDFLKIDIEGSEVVGLKGMPRLLSASDAPTVFIESNGHTLSYFDETPARLKTVLADYGYRSYLIELGRLCPVQPADFQPVTCVDYLALKRATPVLDVCRVDRPLTFKELEVRIVHSAHSSHDSERLYIAKTLTSASAELLRSRRVHEVVELLRQDRCGEVRAAASAISLQPARSAWWPGWHRGIAAIRTPFYSRISRALQRSNSPADRG